MTRPLVDSPRPQRSPLAALLDSDSRHGTYAGAVAHWMVGGRPCEDCARAEWRYRKQRKLKHLRGERVRVPSVGILRRIQALHAIGYTGPQVAKESGVSVNSLRSMAYHGATLVNATTAEKVERAYDRLRDTWPEGHYANRARSIAARRGWVAPDLWWDIDDPNETPDPGYTTPHWRPGDDFDHVVVERILARDFTLAAMTSRAEKEAVCAAWVARGDAANELERLSNWNVRRYLQAGREREAS